MDISGKTALVTGAARRLGKACALALAREKACIVLHYNRSEKDALETAEEIRAMGTEVLLVKADLDRPEETEKLYRESLKLTGTLDILINSASVFPEGNFSGALAEDFLRCSRIHTLSPFLLSRHMASQNKAGVIVNFLDARITDYDREHLPYHISKRELFTLTRALSLELAPLIRVNGVAPGLILPPPGKNDKYLEERKETNPLKMIGTEKEITETVLFLVKNDFITGQIIFVDGGRHLKGSVYGL